LLISEGNYPGRDECRAGAKKTMGDCTWAYSRFCENITCDSMRGVIFCVTHFVLVTCMATFICRVSGGGRDASATR